MNKILRSIKSKIVAHLDRPEITLIIGPRQVGKTTLINEMAKDLEANNKKVIKFNLDIEADAIFFDSQINFLKKLELEIGKDKGYVFIDEVQRKEDAGKFFKGIYDMNLPYKFILTGSGSVELKEKISESLAGRKQIFDMKPVTFIEFLDFKTGYKYSGKIKNFLETNDPKIDSLLNEYMEFGGYPRVILADSVEKKRAEMQEIYTSYLEKDIIQLLKIQKSDSFSKLLVLLSSQIGSGINVSELSNTLGIDSETVNNYLFYLEKTYIIEIVRPFHTNIRSELTKTPIIYFVDLGMRNYSLNRFNHFSMLLEGEHLFENFVFNNLKSQYSYLNPNINYWRTKDGAEVDFVFKIGIDVIPLEIKYKNLDKLSVGKSMLNFIDKYQPKNAYFINLSLNAERKVNNTTIKFISYKEIFIKDITV